ncbi:hypothetical protein MVEN_01796400 [Mycena venus]|uniref:Uncharacterized protein n=1 Tax=Mycena venus TaxID=2733690 RepID=A0A8H6XKC6_9AGAR|nr:hypothetical protein MVEN_01796400 [Mycena venus]
MLQLPSSVLSTYASTSKGLVGLFGGFCVGAQLAFGIALSSLSVPKIQDSVIASRTTKLGLLPTKCVLSNGTVSFPYVAAMGYATIIFASLFCILRAKGFFSRPPSPPPESSASCSMDKDPRWKIWLWILLLLLCLIVMFVVGTYAFFYFACPDSPTAMSAFMSFWVRSLSVAERHFYSGCIAGSAYISTIKSYISTHGFQYSKLFVLAFTSHCICLYVVKAFTRFRGYVRAKATRFHPMMVEPLVVWSLAVAPVAILSSSKLSWILWIPYYYFSHWGDLVGVRWIGSAFLWVLSYLSPPKKLTDEEIFMITGSILIHTALNIPVALFRMTLDLIRRLLYPPNLCIFVILSLYNIAASAAAITCPALLAYAMTEYLDLHLRGKELIIWKAYSCQKSTDSLRVTFWLTVQEYKDWNAGRFTYFQDFISNFLVAAFDSSLETWNLLPLIQKLASRSVFWTAPSLANRDHSSSL